MKINRLDAHERLEHFKQDQEANVFQGVDDCLNRNPDCVEMQQHFPWVYIFGHPRTIELDERLALFSSGIYQTFEDVPTTRMLWQPRLKKPKAETNSYLFRALSKTDLVEIIWLLPPRELWSQYEKGKITESQDVITSIKNFVNHKELLESPHID